MNFLRAIWTKALPQIWRYGKTFLGLVFRHPLVGATAIARLDDNSIILVRRKDDGLWSIPGGLVDWGETVESAVVREVQEETGLTVTSVDRLVGVYSSVGRDPRMHSVCIAVAVHVQGQFAVGDALEISGIRAFPADQVQQLINTSSLSHDHARQLQDYFSGSTALR
ncbi:MAG: NUDIX hydrolase [Cyanophyceae cyanobacterium]